MLKSHFAALEAKLLAESRVAAGAGHSVHKGTPREAFISGFLNEHRGERITIGRGEIIDADSQPGEKRPNIDIVAFRSDYPRLALGGGIGAFLAESVIATIEVKSVLTADELEHAARIAAWVKARKRTVLNVMTSGYQPPGILCFAVAYEGPATMQRVQAWIGPTHAKIGVREPALGPTQAERLRVPSPSLDGIFVLGKGFVVFDNSPISVVTDAHRQLHPLAKWIVCDVSDSSLLVLFLWLTVAASGVTLAIPDPTSYLARTTMTVLFTP